MRVRVQHPPTQTRCHLWGGMNSCCLKTVEQTEFNILENHWTQKSKMQEEIASGA